MESALAANGYASAAKSTATPRGIEYRIFARITRNLTDAKSLSKKEFPKFAEAVHENLKLWTLLGADVAQEGNQLPVELRSQIFYLAEFTRAHTRKVLGGDADINALIDINTSIMRGLRSNVEVKETD